MKVVPGNFAPIIAAMMVLWPIMAFMGAQGFTGAVAIGGLLALPFLRFRQVPLYAVLFGVFLLYVIVRSVLGPSSEPFMEGHVLSGDFSVNAPSARFTLLSLAAIAVLVATSTIGPEAAPRSVWVCRVSALFQGCSVLVVAFFMPQIIALIVSTGQSDPASMLQNLLRNANTFALLLPFLWLWLSQSRTIDYGRWAWGLILALAFLAFWLSGTQTALVATVAMLVFMAVVRRFPRFGLAGLFHLLAVYVLLAPLILPIGAQQLLRFGIDLPGSFYSRVKGWQLVGEKITEAPLFGHGLEATYDWGQVFSDRPEWLAEAEARFGSNAGWANYEILNSHPHNMPLQIWAETGLIGAVCIALTLIFLGRRAAKLERGPTVVAAAGLLGIAAIICSVNYSIWNEAYWASVTIALGLLIVNYRNLSRKV